LALSLPGVARAATGHGARGPMVLEADVKSDYSHIRIKRQGTVEFMFFVRDSGEEACETMVNLKKPHELVSPYSRYMFASYLLVPKQKQVLIAGLGGGAMVHFYQHYDPEVKVDAVEIDPAVVELADKYFHTRPNSTTTIITDDVFHHLDKAEAQYDVIYMDAFLKPSVKTDKTGLPLVLKTLEFYKRLHEKLTPEGIVVVNLNAHARIDDDVDTLRGAFAQVYLFRTKSPNLVAVCSPAKSRRTMAELRDRAKELDRRFKATFLFYDLLNTLTNHEP
jgi:spermidine synthase